MKQTLKTRWPQKSSFKRLLAIFFANIIICFSVLAQERSVSGTITDKDGNSLPGVNVLIKGTTTGVVSDVNGKFTIKVSGNTAVLAFTFIGYVSQEIAVGESATVDVKLLEDVKELNEVVVIGYGVQKKSDLTGSVASVKAEDITKVPSYGIANTLQGRATGVQVSQETGAPGSNVKIRIRGISSLNGGDPLWVIDGIPGGNQNTVNPNDIESIEILKDGSSAAIYGANGGNGVILVTTKRGKAGKASAEVNYFHGYQDVSKRLEMATGPQYEETYTEQEALRGLKTFRYPDWKNAPTYDYQNLVFRVAPMDNLSFNVSGGTEKLKTYLSMGYLNQEGIFKSSSFQKFNFRLNSDYTVTDWFKVGETMGFNQQTQYGLEDWQYENEYASPLMGALTVLPYMPAYDSIGNFVPKKYGQNGDPMVGIDLLHKTLSKYEGQGTFYAIIEPFKGLSFESRISSGITYNNNYTFSPTFYYGPGVGESNTHSTIYRYMQQNTNYDWQNLIKYNTTFLEKIDMSAVVGYEAGGSQGMDISGTRRDLLSEDPEMQYFNASQDITSQGSQLVAGGGYKNTSYSYLGRISLDYKDKYLIQGNFRRDGSSRFGPDKRFGNFPGFSVGWKFSEEDFVKNGLPFLSFGKLRYALGNNGNNAIRDYAYYATVSVLQHSQYSFSNTTSETLGAAPNVLANQAVHWEDIRNQNLGIDLNFLDNKLSLSVDNFQRYNIGMLRPTTVPAFAGWTVRDNFQEAAGVDPRPITNIGKMTNKGWEFSIGWKDAVGKLKYSIDASYTYVKSNATNLGADSVILGGGSAGLNGTFIRTQTGGEIGEFYGYKVDRLFNNNDPTRLVKRGSKWVPVITNQPYTTKANATDPTKTDTIFAQSSAQAGDFKWADLNHDGKITSDDQTNLGNPNPSSLFSVNMYFEYGWFDLSLFWQGVAGNKIFNTTKYYGVVSSGDYNWSKDYVNNHYRASEVIAKDAGGNTIVDLPANTNAKYPRIDYLNTNANFSTISDFYIEDGSYLRLKNIQLGMTLPKTWVNKIGLSEFKLFVGATNLLTFTKYTGMDPEVPQTDPLNSGVDKAAYPQARQFTFGANVKF